MAEADALKFELPSMAKPPRRAGDKLREARERAGIARAELALRTKINQRHLKLIEEGDFAALPARIYALGFARTYAGAVGLDGAAIVAQVRSELDERDHRAAARHSHRIEIEDPARIPSKRLAWLAGALGLAVLALLAAFWPSFLSPAVDLPPVRGEDARLAAMPPPALNPAAPISPTAESAVPSAAPSRMAASPNARLGGRASPHVPERRLGAAAPAPTPAAAAERPAEGS